MSRAAIVLALAPSIAVWALRRTMDFEWVVVLGTIALLGGVLVLARRLPPSVKLGVAAFAGLTLLGTTGLEMRARAGIRPFSLWAGLNQKDLSELTHPVASEGEVILAKPGRGVGRTILAIESTGQVVWKGRRTSLAEVDPVLGRFPDAEILLRCDQDLPFAHFGWIGALCAAHGHEEVRLVVRRFGRLPGDEALGAEMSGEYWPELQLALPITAREGARVRLEATGWREGIWPPFHAWLDDGVPRSTQRIPTGARYHFEGRATDDLKELAGWIRAVPPRSIEAGARVPLKYVVAVENEVRKAGHPPAALVLPAPPPKNLWQATVLPYPLAD